MIFLITDFPLTFLSNSFLPLFQFFSSSKDYHQSDVCNTPVHKIIGKFKICTLVPQALGPLAVCLHPITASTAVS